MKQYKYKSSKALTIIALENDLEAQGVRTGSKVEVLLSYEDIYNLTKDYKSSNFIEIGPTKNETNSSNGYFFLELQTPRYYICVKELKD